jgi:hypothetical protein
MGTIKSDIPSTTNNTNTPSKNIKIGVYTQRRDNSKSSCKRKYKCQMKQKKQKSSSLFLMIELYYSLNYFCVCKMNMGSRQKAVVVKPPEKGSFALDHHGECNMVC